MKNGSLLRSISVSVQLLKSLLLNNCVLFYLNAEVIYVHITHTAITYSPV